MGPGGANAQGIVAGQGVYNISGHGNVIGAASPFASGLVSLHQLPACPVLIGRDAVLTELADLIRSGIAAGAAISGSPAPHAGLLGMGGVGKTDLAVALAYRVKDLWPTAQLMLDLRGADPQNRAPVSPVEAMSKIILTFHPQVRLPEDVESLAPRYRSALADAGNVLLLLDNAADADQVEPLLPPPNCLLLVTSRRQFDVSGVAARSLDCLSPEQSRVLLLKYAPRLGGHADAAAELCGCLPLALRVFAEAVNKRKLTPVPELVARLRARQDRLSKVEAAFAVSEEQLSAVLRHRWHLLSVFAASFTLEAATAVWAQPENDDVRSSMEELVRANLVEWNESTGRFRLHDLIRQFCTDKLSPSETEAVHFCHARHYTEVGELADKLYLQGGGSVIQGLALFDAERVHLNAAFEWLISHSGRQAAEAMVSLVDAVVYSGSLRFHPRERIRWLEAQYNTARLGGDRAAESRAFGNLGNCYANLGEPRRAIELYEQQLAIAREIGDRRNEGSSLNNLGNCYANLGEPHRAIELYEQQLAIAREIGDRRNEGSSLNNLGNRYAELGEPHRAIELYEQQLAIAREIGDRRNEGSSLNNLGNCYANLGEPHRAIELYEQQLAIAREIGDRRNEGSSLGGLGNRHAELGEPHRAIELYEQQLAIAREIGDRRNEGNALFNSAHELWNLGAQDDAIARADAALVIFDAIGSPHAAKVQLVLGQWREAKT